MTFEEWGEIHEIRHSTGQDTDDEGLILADWKAEREQLISQLAKARELEEGISEIIDCVAKVSVDIHHSESGEKWRKLPLLAEKEKV